MKLSIIIPVFNEGATIEAVLKKIESVVLPPGLTREIVIINDGSSDDTAHVLERWHRPPQFQLFSLSENHGKTYAVRYGIEKSSGDILLIQDADLEYDPCHYPALLAPILAGQSDIVYGSRFIGQIQHMELINRLANKISIFTINLLYATRLTDFHTCYKVFRRSALEGITIESRNFSFDTEITVKFLSKHHPIHEVPIQYVARTRQQGKKITWGKALETYAFLWKYRFFGGKKSTNTPSTKPQREQT